MYRAAAWIVSFVLRLYLAVVNAILVLEVLKQILHFLLRNHEQMRQPSSKVEFGIPHPLHEVLQLQ